MIADQQKLCKVALAVSCTEKALVAHLLMEKAHLASHLIATLDLQQTQQQILCRMWQCSLSQQSMTASPCESKRQLSFLSMHLRCPPDWRMYAGRHFCPSSGP